MRLFSVFFFGRIRKRDIAFRTIDAFQWLLDERKKRQAFKESLAGLSN